MVISVQGLKNFYRDLKQFFFDCKLLLEKLVSFCVNILSLIQWAEVIRDLNLESFGPFTTHCQRWIIPSILQHISRSRIPPVHLRNLIFNSHFFNLSDSAIIEIVPLSILKTLDIGVIVTSLCTSGMDQNGEKLIHKLTLLDILFNGTSMRLFQLLLLLQLPDLFKRELQLLLFLSLDLLL